MTAVRGRSLSTATLVSACLALASATSGAEKSGGSDSAAPSARIESVLVRDRIESGAVLIRTQESTVALLTQAAVAEYSQVGVPFLEANQEAALDVLEVTKKDGRKLDLAASAPRDVAPLLPPNLPIYSDLRLLRAAVPSLEIGDRIRFGSTVKVKPLVENQVWNEMVFAAPENVELQRYELDVPDGLRLTVHARSGFGAAFEEEHKDGRWIRRWTVERKVDAAVSPGVSEGDKSSKADKEVEPDIEITSFASWDEFGKWWSSLAPPIVDPAVEAKAKELTAGKTTRLDQLRALHRYVAQEIRYLTLPLGIGRFRARDPDEILRTGLGDCKDKTRLLASLGASLGIEVDQVLVYASAKRKLVEEAPSPLQFDHVILRARLGLDPIKDVIWMDPTSEMTPMGRLPPEARNRRGVALVADGKAAKGKAAGAGVRAEIVATPEGKFRLDTRTETVGSIDANGLIRAKVRWTFEGDVELLRLAFKYGDDSSRGKSVENLRSEWDDDGKVVDWTNSPPADLDSPFWVEYDIEWPMTASVWRKPWTLWVPVPRLNIDAPPDEAEQGGDSKSGGPVEELTLGESEHQVVIARIDLPDGVKVQPPVPVSARREFAEFRSAYAVEGHTLTLERELTRKADSLAPAQFDELRAFRELIENDRNQEFDIAAAPELATNAPADADELYADCFAALNENRNEDAERLCRKATEVDPKHKSAWNSLGNALTALGREKEAEAAFRRQIEVDPEDEHAYRNLAIAAWRRGELDAAEKLIRQQIDVAPLAADAYDALGRLQIQRGKLDDAVSSLQRAAKLDPKSESVVEAMFELDARLGRVGELAELAVEHPDLPRKPDQRLRVAEIALDHAKGPWSKLGVWFERLRSDSERALESFDAAKPTVSELVAVWGLGVAWEAEGSIALEEHRPQDALRLFDSALRVSGSPSAAAWKAEALHELGNDDAARLQLAIAVALAQPEADRFERVLAARVSSPAELSKVTMSGAEESWKVRSVTCKVRAAAGAEGEIWLLFAADGHVMSATASKAGALTALAAGLEADPPSLPLPPGNRARLPLKAVAFCSPEGDCTLSLERPRDTWWQMSGGSKPATN